MRGPSILTVLFIIGCLTGNSDETMSRDQVKATLTQKRVRADYWYVNFDFQQGRVLQSAVLQIAPVLV
jgi:hypothetical protein